MLSKTYILYVDQGEGKHYTFSEILERDPDFYSLKPHLSILSLEVSGEMSGTVGGKITEEIQRIEITMIKDGHRPALTQTSMRILTDEIGRIEKRWGLV